jgi:hypothetical protein
MNHGRWYPSLTGWVDPVDNTFKVIAMSGYTEAGSGNLNLIPELYTPTGGSAGWSEINDGNNYGSMPLTTYYPAGHVIPYGPNAGKIFYTTPQRQGYNFDPLGGGTTTEKYWKAYGNLRSYDRVRFYGNSVLLPILPDQSKAKVLIIGGNLGAGQAFNDCEIIDLNITGTPTWSTLSNNMNIRRVNQNAVLLPDQTILVVGGNQNNGTVDPVTTAELLDVRDQDNIASSGAWVEMATATVPRNYHSTALLLPDGSVITLGGRLTSIDATDDKPYAYDFESDLERRLEVYTPYYLTDGARPSIVTYPDPDTDPIAYNSTFEITLDSHSPTWKVDSIVLIRPGSCTHALDMEQRMIVLHFKLSSGVYTCISPLNANIALPGYYMLFVVLQKSHSTSGNSNIPSYSKFVKLTV